MDNTLFLDGLVWSGFENWNPVYSQLLYQVTTELLTRPSQFDKIRPRNQPCTNQKCFLVVVTFRVGVPFTKTDVVDWRFDYRLVYTYDARTSISISISHVWTGTTQAQAQEKGTRACACVYACVVRVTKPALPERESSPESFSELTTKMTSAQVVAKLHSTTTTTTSWLLAPQPQHAPSLAEDHSHLDGHNNQTVSAPGFTPFARKCFHNHFSSHPIAFSCTVAGVYQLCIIHHL